MLFLEKKFLFEEVAAPDVVALRNSMTVNVGLMAGKKELGCVPPGENACYSPNSKIQNFCNNIENDINEKFF